MESAALFDAEPSQAERAAAAVECLHAYSLVHDDLPSMDDDALRRGKPTVHVAWDEATAILAGDALQALAFELLLAPETGTDAVRVDLALALARAVGLDGLVGGQALDLAAEAGPAPDAAEVEALQARKTGALLAFSAEAGAILGRAPLEDRRRLADYARDLGAAFQIRDDLLDIEGDAEAAGKRLRKDAEAGKATLVAALGAEAARARAEALAQSAAARLEPYGSRALRLVEAARFAVERRS
jgi:farnesyl diphosphate synthase